MVLNYGLIVQTIVKNVYLYAVSDSLEKIIEIVPAVAVLLFFLRYFIKGYEEEKKENKKLHDADIEKSKQDSKVMEGMKVHVQESNKKQDETNLKIDLIIRKLDK